jgi:hypothetical protein
MRSRSALLLGVILFSTGCHRSAYAPYFEKAAGELPQAKADAVAAGIDLNAPLYPVYVRAKGNSAALFDDVYRRLSDVRFETRTAFNRNRKYDNSTFGHDETLANPYLSEVRRAAAMPLFSSRDPGGLDRFTMVDLSVDLLIMDARFSAHRNDLKRLALDLESLGSLAKQFYSNQATSVFWVADDVFIKTFSGVVRILGDCSGNKAVAKLMLRELPKSPEHLFTLRQVSVGLSQALESTAGMTPDRLVRIDRGEDDQKYVPELANYAGMTLTTFRSALAAREIQLFTDELRVLRDQKLDDFGRLRKLRSIEQLADTSKDPTYKGLVKSVADAWELSMQERARYLCCKAGLELIANPPVGGILEERDLQIVNPLSDAPFELKPTHEGFEIRGLDAAEDDTVFFKYPVYGK